MDNLSKADFFIDSRIEAEKALLDLADYLYINSNIKPYSRVIYILSRLIALNGNLKKTNSADEALIQLKKSFPDILEEQDYNSDYLFSLVGKDFPYIKKVVLKVLSTAPSGTDTLGLIFNTLLRGKFEAGEGLGTFLTPEEVVQSMISICAYYYFLSNTRQKCISFSDVTGGTGRFAFEFSKYCRENKIQYSALLADQSKFSLDLAKINFILSGEEDRLTSIDVKDSIIDHSINHYSGSFDIICTNPPFGANKYPFNNDLIENFEYPELSVLGLTSIGTKTDPAYLFFLKNLKLLAFNGVMGIVLPDGVIYSKQFFELIKNYKKENDQTLAIKAIVSLPVATFSLGGTVAKTSFVIIQKTNEEQNNLTYIAAAEHVGFLKKGNRRIADINGNDLELITHEIVYGKIGIGKNVTLKEALKIETQYSNFSSLVINTSRLIRDYQNGDKPTKCYHISILDIDETGFINFNTLLKNNPTTKPMICKANDILISCINPKIWRATIVPELMDFEWTCSSEFAIFRPNNKHESICLYYAVMQKSFKEVSMKYAKGTSSSRQRINKADLQKIKIALPNEEQFTLVSKLVDSRKKQYLERLEDLHCSASLWSLTD